MGVNRLVPAEAPGRRWRGHPKRWRARTISLKGEDEVCEHYNNVTLRLHLCYTAARGRAGSSPGFSLTPKVVAREAPPGLLQSGE